MNKLYQKYLPIYFKFWPNYWLAIWSAPVRYGACGNLEKRNDSYWKALRVTIRKGENHSQLVCILKHGVV